MATIIGSGLEGYLHRQARRRALNLIAEAKEEARRTLEQATVETAALRQRAKAEAERTIQERRKRTVAKARMQAKLLVANRVEDTISELWDAAAAELRRCADGTPQQRLALIQRLTVDAAEQLGGGQLVLAVRAEDRPLLTDAVLQALHEDLAQRGIQAELTLTNEDAPISGGVIVQHQDGRQIVDNSLDQRLSLVERTMRNEVSRLLSEDGATPKDAAGSRDGPGEPSSM